MAGNITYDKALGEQAAQGTLVNYVPDTAQTLASKTGICYDFSALYAALCLSQGIPCALVKGDHQGSYHAWNMVYVDGQWSPVDLTKAIANRDVTVTDFSQCVLTQEGYTAAAF